MTIATLADIPISTRSSVRWAIMGGVEPVQETFVFENSNSIRSLFIGLANGHVPVTLSLGGGGGSATISGLFITGVFPGDDPGDIKVQASDLRWVWKYRHIRRSFNVLRRSGFRRRGQWQDLLQQQVSPKFRYAKFSLVNPEIEESEAYTARTAMESVLSELSAYSGDEIGYAFSYDLSTLAKFDSLPMEDVLLDDAGSVAVSRLLGFFPGTGVYVGSTGTVRFYDKTSGREVDTVVRLGMEIEGGGHIDEIRNAHLRPREIEVLFTPEVEVRFDFEEAVEGVAGETFTADERFIENVLPVPDFSLTLPNGEVVAQGTYLSIGDYLDAISDPPGTMTQITFQTIRRAFVPEMGLWNALYLTGQLDVAQTDADWASRLAAIQAHWRTTYRLNRNWVDNSQSIKPYLVATLDVVQGQRAPAMAFSDYAIHASVKSMYFAALNGAEGMPVMFNMDGYPEGQINSQTLPAPARISILDEDQGIVHVAYQIDPYRFGDAVLPGKILSEKCPRANPEVANLYSIAFDAVPGDAIAGDGRIPELESGFQLALLLTMVPASSNKNSQQQYVKKTVKPSDVSAFLTAQGVGIGGMNLQSSFGPKLQVRIGANYETARIAWQDDRSEDIEKLFGIIPGDPDLSGLVVNASDGKGVVRNDAINAASIDAIALAVASQVYAGYIDHLQGTAQGIINGGLHPDGWLSQVVHNVTPEGAATTTVVMPERIEPLDLLAFMDNSTRKIILKLSQLQK